MKNPGLEPGRGEKIVVKCRRFPLEDRQNYDFANENSGTQLWGTVPGTTEFRDSVSGTDNFPGHGPGPVPTPGLSLQHESNRPCATNGCKETL